MKKKRKKMMNRDKDVEINKEAFAELPFSEEDKDVENNKEAFAELPGSTCYTEEKTLDAGTKTENLTLKGDDSDTETVKGNNTESDPTNTFESDSDSSGYNHSESSSEQDPFVLERYLRTLQNLPSSSESSSSDSKSSVNSQTNELSSSNSSNSSSSSIAWGGGNGGSNVDGGNVTELPVTRSNSGWGSWGHSSISSDVSRSSGSVSCGNTSNPSTNESSMWSLPIKVNKKTYTNPEDPPFYPSNNSIGDVSSDLGKIRLRNPRPKYEACKSMSTNKSSSTTDYNDPIGLESKNIQDTKQSLDDKIMYGDSSYKNPDNIYNTFSKKEIEDLNEGRDSKTLTKERFNDIIQEKLDKIDLKTNFVIKEHIGWSKQDLDNISLQIKEFQEWGELDKSNLTYLGDEMWAELENNNFITYRVYKKLTSACNFSASSMEETRELSIWTDVILRILDDILEDESLPVLALIFSPILIVFIIYLWYRNKKK